MAVRTLRELRQEVYKKAMGPRSTFKDLEPFTRHADSESRAVLALNTRDPEILRIQSTDPDWRVREEVAMNHFTPSETVEALKHDKNPGVSYQAKIRLVGDSENLRMKAFHELREALRAPS